MSSFKDNWAIFENPTSFPISPTFQNFVEVWIAGNFSIYFMNSIIITLASLVGILLLSTMAGYGFARWRFKGSDFLFNLFILSMVVVPSSIMIAEYELVSFLGLLNTFPGVIFVYLSWTVFGIIMSRQSFADLPQELIDVARIDGCNELTIYLRILLPLIRPAVATIGIFEFVWVWNDFIWPLILLQQPGQETVTLGLLTLRGQYLADWGILTAGLTIAFIPVLILYFVFQNNFVEGLVAGSLKE